MKEKWKIQISREKYDILKDKCNSFIHFKALSERMEDDPNLITIKEIQHTFEEERDFKIFTLETDCFTYNEDVLIIKKQNVIEYNTFFKKGRIHSLDSKELSVEVQKLDYTDFSLVIVKFDKEYIRSIFDVDLNYNVEILDKQLPEKVSAF